MQNLTLEQLPAFVAAMAEKIDWICDFLRSKEEKTVAKDRHVLVDLDRACEILGKAKPTVYNMTSERRIPFRKQGNKLYFYEDELYDWIDSGGQSGAGDTASFDSHLQAIQASKKRKPASGFENPTM